VGQKTCFWGRNGLFFDVKVKEIEKRGCFRENPEKPEKPDFGGRPYRPLFSVKIASKPTESLGPQKPGFQKRALAEESEKRAIFREKRVFREKWPFFGFPYFIREYITIEPEKCLNRPF
jgi:hypothetical protein